MPTLLMRIADRVLNTPLLITPEKAEVITAVLSGRIGVDAPDASRFVGSPAEKQADGSTRFKPYNVKDGVAVVTITGTLVNRGAWIGANSGLTSYEGIAHQVSSAAADPAVGAIILDLHSPGGEAVGAMEAAEVVRLAAKAKPVIAVVNGMAASAAYAIASGATEIVTTETGVAGSIGVVLLHADFSRQLDREGITPTLIFAGAHKVDGNPYGPLPESVRQGLQAEVDAFYELFVTTVAKGRGSRLNAAAARRTEARVFIGQAAVEAGIADRVGTFERVLADLSRAKGRTIPVHRGDSRMDDAQGVTAATEDAGIPKATHDAAVRQARADGEATGDERGRKVGAETERLRLSAIINADGIKGNALRLAAALELAAKSPAMTAEDIVAFTVANVSEPAQASSSAALSGRAAKPDSLGQAGIGAEGSKKRDPIKASAIYEQRRTFKPA